MACRASVAGSFGSCRACGQLSASSGWFGGSFCFGPQVGRYGRFSRPFLRFICTRLWASSCRFWWGLPGVWASSGCCSSGSSWAGGVLVASSGPQVAGFRVFLAALPGACGQPLGSKILGFRCLFGVRGGAYRQPANKEDPKTNRLRHRVQNTTEHRPIKPQSWP